MSALWEYAFPHIYRILDNVNAISNASSSL